MSVTRGLAELKLLDKRIADTMKFSVISIQQGKKKIANQFTRDEFESGCKSVFSSVTDLIDRRKKIKSAIVASNADIIVMIGGHHMTVAEAIERKTSIKYEQDFLKACREQLAHCLTVVNQENEKVKARLDVLLQQNFGKDSKTSAADVEAISVPFMEQNEVKLVDPLGLQGKIDGMSESIDGFLSEVDYVLSESNTLTKITV
jgi:hypothetical protein